MGRFIDLTGQTFGHLFVLKRVENDKLDKAQFLIRCDVNNCGKERVVSGNRLTRKKQPMIHCGCLTVKDILGQRFGHLTVLKFVGRDKIDKPLFLIRCNVENCGKEIIVRRDRLIHKNYPMVHCGCLTFQHMSDALKGNNATHGLSKTREYWVEHSAKRKIKKQKNNAGVNLSYAEPFAMPRLELDYCVYCGSTDKPSIDHIIPIDKGGTQDPKNLIRACLSCNSSKNNSFFIDWYLKNRKAMRSLTEIISDMGFDSIFSLQHYQNDMSPKYAEENIALTVTKILRAEKKSIRLLDLYYRSLDHYPTH